MTSKPSPDGSEKKLDSAAILRLSERAEAIPADDRRRIAASVAMFERLAEHWSLRADERDTLLGGISKSTWSEWRQRPASARIKSDTRERIANLFTIDLNAHALFAPEFADRWVREPNVAFAAASPMARMLRGRVEDVISVRRYLERIRTLSAAGDARSEEALAAENLAVSYLPGTAIESDEEAALPTLRFAAAMCERLALRDPSRYQPALASALHTLATCLDERNDSEALQVLRRAIELERQIARKRPDFAVELLGSFTELLRALRKYGDLNEADAISIERRAMYERCDRLVNRGTV